MEYIIVMNKNTMPNTNNDYKWMTHKEHEERRDTMQKEHEKETFIQGAFMGFLIGSFAMALMIHFLQSL